MIVMKFGGSSVGDGKCIAKVAGLVKKEKRKKVVVVSAMAGITDKLISTAKRIVDLPTNVVEKEVDLFYRDLLLHHRSAVLEAVSDKKITGEILERIIDLLNQLKMTLLGVGYLEDLTPRSLDYIMSFGERLSVLIMEGALRSQGVKAQSLTGYEAGIITNSSFGRAKPIHNKIKRDVKARLNPLLSHSITPVVTGFIACDPNARITTLGRGGSDYTASLIGRYLGVREVQIWTDVDGILTTDPKIVKSVRLIGELSYVEAMDLAYFGAKVIHSKMIEPAMLADIPVRVKNTFNPDVPGTLIVRKQKKVEGVIKAIAVASNVDIVNIQGVGMMETPNIAGRVFSALGGNNINVIMISGSSESNLSFVVSRDDSGKTIEVLETEFGDEGVRNIGLMEDVSIITIVGVGMRGTKGVAAKIFDTVARAGVNIIMIAQGSSEVNISFIVGEKDSKKAVVALHERFIG